MTIIVTRAGKGSPLTNNEMDANLNNLNTQGGVITTVASATTPDIFAVSVGRVIDYTGTATATGFVAAPQAGMEKELLCAGAAVFTAGANLVIAGTASASNYTAAAGDRLLVVAETTTKFRMYVLKASGAPNFAAGTVAAPAIYLSTDTGTGLYRIGANNDGFAISGTKLLDFGSALLGITGAATISTTLGVTGATTLSSTLAAGNTTITGTLNVAGTTKITSGTLAANSSSSVFAVGVDTQDYVKGYFTGTVNGTSGGAFAVGVGFFGTFDSGSTSYGTSFYSAPNTAAAAYTVTNGNHIWLRDWNKGAGSSITIQRGILIDDQTGGGTANRGVESNINSGSGKWNIYAAGTAGNHFAGAFRQGSANPESVAGTTSTSSFLTTTSSNWALALINNSTTPYGLGISHNTDSNNTSNDFIYCTGAGTLRMSVRSNGGVCNVQANDANTSDVRLKKNIELAGNYLDKICAIPVKTYLYKDQTDEFLNLGVIAQDVEAVAPELIDSGGFGETPEDGIPLKAVYQTDLQYALMKAIQELAAKVAKLEAA